MTPAEVRYERLRPVQIVERRIACPVAYLPIGTIEWHGPHNPVGLDTLKMHALLIHCAREIGGLVFPPLYYGECREQALMEANAADRDRIAEEMGLTPDHFAPGHMYQAVSDQNTNYHHLLLHMLHEVRSLGFTVCVIGAGHYPLLDHARAAVAVFHQAQRSQAGQRMLAWAMTGYELLRGEGSFSPCGDHAGKWETSLLMYLDPGMQDLSLLPEDRRVAPVGTSNNGVQDANAEFGQQATEAIVEKVRARVTDLVSQPQHYSGHGAPM
jgi:creatinine amidohydrolase